MTIDRLAIYNRALRFAGERKTTLTEEWEPRRLLDDAWDSGTVKYCLEQGLWNFALRTKQLTFAPSIAPEFGHDRAFEKPIDFVRTAGIWEDEFLRTPLVDYEEEGNFWFTSTETIYVKYVSDDDVYGLDFSKWPQTFFKYTAAEFALEILPKLKGVSVKADDLKETVKELKIDARSKDAMEEPARFAPTGSWGLARHGRRAFGRRDGGSRHRLIG